MKRSLTFAGCFLTLAALALAGDITGYDVAPATPGVTGAVWTSDGATATFARPSGYQFAVAGLQVGRAVASNGDEAALDSSGNLGDLTYADNSASSNANAFGVEFVQVSPAVAGTECGWQATSSAAESGAGPNFAWNGRKTSTTQYRLFVGLATDPGVVVSSDTPAGESYIGLSASTDNSDTNWQIIHDDADGTPTRVDTGVAVSASALIFTLNTTTGASFDWAIYNRIGVLSASGTISTEIPGTTEELFPCALLEPRDGNAVTLATSGAMLGLVQRQL